MNTRSRRFLLALWDGGGNVPPELGVARRLVEHGHQVHVLGDPTFADAAEAAGCSFSPWQRAPHRRTFDPSDDLLKDWEATDPLDALRRLRDQLHVRPGVGLRRGHGRRHRGLPSRCPAGRRQSARSGHRRGGVGASRRRPWSRTSGRSRRRAPGMRRSSGSPTGCSRAGLPDLNAARAERGLPPLTSLYDQVLGVDRILVLSSETFDTASAFVPANVRYVGPVLDDPAWTEPWSSPWPEDNTDPLVLVGFSSMYQNQGSLVQRVIDALSGWRCGPWWRSAGCSNRRRSPRRPTSPSCAPLRTACSCKEASVVVSHCGHGTTMKALAAGVPMVCIPMGRDQDGTAARVVGQGAGRAALAAGPRRPRSAPASGRARRRRVPRQRGALGRDAGVGAQTRRRRRRGRTPGRACSSRQVTE